MAEKKIITGNSDHRQLIRRQAGRLAELLQHSPEYRQFIAARQRLEADESQFSVLAELRQQQMALRMASLFGEDEDEDAREWERMYVLLSQEPLISDYLFAEGRFFRLLSDVEEVFTAKLDLWESDEETPLPIPHPGPDLWLN